MENEGLVVTLKCFVIKSQVADDFAECLLMGFKT